MAHQIQLGSACSVLRTGALALACVLAGCHDNLLVPDANSPPVAVARVSGMADASVTIPSMGETTTVMLDGSGSMDPEGGKLIYRWLSGTPALPSGELAAGSGGEPAASSGDEPAAGGAGPATPAGGIGGSGAAPSSGARGRWVPADDKAWPDDVENPVVQLPDGDYAFLLWVIDDKGVVSDPDLIRVSVGGPR